MVERLLPKAKGAKYRYPDKRNEVSDKRKHPSKKRELGNFRRLAWKRNKGTAKHAPPRNGGRRKGDLNRTTAILKDAILIAATEVGEDGEGLNGLVGYLKTAAIEYPTSFMQLLGRVLPYQLSVRAHDNVKDITQTMTPAEAVQIYVDTLHGLSQGYRSQNLIDVSPKTPPPADSNGHLKE